MLPATVHLGKLLGSFPMTGANRSEVQNNPLPVITLIQNLADLANECNGDVTPVKCHCACLEGKIEYFAQVGIISP